MINMNKYLRTEKDFEWNKKPWGGERVIVNDQANNLCYKKMFLMAGKFCSIHYHRHKAEFFVVESGELKVEYVEPGDWDHKLFDESFIKLCNMYSSLKVQYITLFANQVFFVPPYMLHRFTGVKDSVFLEVSTHDKASDSYRLFPSCQG